MSRALSPIIPGAVNATVMRLEAPISFWGGVDYETGTIIDVTHPQRSQCIGGHCLVIPSIRGSGGTPGNLADTIRRGCGPAGIVLGYPDINVMVGIKVANKLYDRLCPLFVCTPAQLDEFRSGERANILETGAYTLDPGYPQE